MYVSKVSLMHSTEVSLVSSHWYSFSHLPVQTLSVTFSCHMVIHQRLCYFNYSTCVLKCQHTHTQKKRKKNDIRKERQLDEEEIITRRPLTKLVLWKGSIRGNQCCHQIKWMRPEDKITITLYEKSEWFQFHFELIRQ